MAKKGQDISMAVEHVTDLSRHQFPFTESAYWTSKHQQSTSSLMIFATFNTDQQ